MAHMISGSISLLTSLAMLAHSVLGCCWHHAHADCRHESQAVVSESAPAEHHEHACRHDHAHVSTGERHQHAAHADATRPGCCGEDHGQHDPLACCGEVECTYLPTASPVLTGPVGVSLELPSTAVLALGAGIAPLCGADVDGGPPASTAAVRCALGQVWRL